MPNVSNTLIIYDIKAHSRWSRSLGNSEHELKVCIKATNVNYPTSIINPYFSLRTQHILASRGLFFLLFFKY